MYDGLYHKANDEDSEFYRVFVGKFDKGSVDNEIHCKGKRIHMMQR